MKEQPESELDAELAALRQRLNNLEAERDAARHQAPRAQRPTFLRMCLLGPLPLAFFVLGGGLLYAQGDALFIDAMGNVGIGNLTPQGFQVVLPEKNKPANPKAGITLAGGLDGNASIEVRNNGTGTPYIDFAQTTGSDYDARLRLIAPGRLAIEGADLFTAGSVGIGSNPPKAKLHVVGDTRIDGGVTSKAVHQPKNGTATTYEISPRYHLSVTANGATKPIPKQTLIDLCGDPDGCEVRMGTTQWNSSTDTATVARHFLFYYSPSDMHWMSSFGDKGGTLGNGLSEQAAALWSCLFTDGTYLNNSNEGDKNDGMALMVLPYNDHRNPDRTCELTLID